MNGDKSADSLLGKSDTEQFSSSHRHGSFLFTEGSNSVIPEKNSVTTQHEKPKPYSESGHFAHRTIPWVTCVHTQAHSHTWGGFSLHLYQYPVLMITERYVSHSHVGWQHIYATELPVDVPGNSLRAVPLSLETKWIPSRGLASLPGQQMRAWDSGLKVDFLHSWAKSFQPSSQMFLYMVLAAMAWDRARIWPDFYTEKLFGMLGWCHPIIKGVVLQIATPFPFALGVSPKGRGAGKKVGVSTQSMPGAGQRRGGRGLGRWMK